MRRSANGDINTQTHDRAIVTNAAARAAVADVWNSLMYENPADDAPATLIHSYFKTEEWHRNIDRELTQISISTYNAPARNRNRTIEIVFTEKHDANEKTNAPIAATRNTFFLPQVSAKKPQKCDVNTIPK